MEVSPLSLTLYKNQLQMDQRSVKPETLKLLEKNIGKTLEDIGMGKAFLNRTPTAQKIRTRIEKLGCIKFKSSVQQENNYQNQKKTHRMEEIICQFFIR
jgi:hypothetical protein